jgi:hypothetical protein
MRLPRSVQEIADVIGRERALYLIGQLPRCVAGAPGKQSSRVMLYVPTVSRLTLQHELVRILGYKDAVKMCRHFGGEILQPANCSEIYRNYRDRMIDSYLQERVSVAHISAIFCVSRETVNAVRRLQKPQEDSPVAANDNAPSKRRARAVNASTSRYRGKPAA